MVNEHSCGACGLRVDQWMVCAMPRVWGPLFTSISTASCPSGVNRVVLTLCRLLPVFPGKKTFSAATPIGCKRFERGAGAVYKKRAGIFSRHHDDTMMRDENRVKKCDKYLILLNKLAGVVQWQNGSFPSCIRGFDSLRPLQSPRD